MSGRSEPLRIVIIGAGRLASCLAPALHKGGAEVVQVWSRTEGSAMTLASAIGCEASWGRFDGIVRDADIYLICVKDNAIADVAHGLRESVGPKPVIAHTSGGTDLSAITTDGGGRVGVFYPLQSFTTGRTIDFSVVHFFLEASDAEVMEQLEALALTATPASNIHRLSSADRRRMHLAAVFVSNFVNHCCTLADDILRQTGIGFEVMRPLLAETVAKLDSMSPCEAQTGPALRWDTGVLDAHRALLSDTPLTQNIYDLLSESIHKHS